MAFGFRYFVSYAYERGHGHCEIYYRKLIRNIFDVKGVKEIIDQNRGEERIDAIVLQYKLFGITFKRK